MMRFCEICDNLTYLTTSKDDNQLKYHCRSCKQYTSCDDNINTSVYKNNYGGSKNIYYEMFINKYTKYDPTLPHVNNMQCQNENCNSHKQGIDSDIIYIRYDEEKMKYIYLCCVCDKAWIHPEYQKTKFISAN